MDFFHQLRTRLAGLFRRRNLEAEMAEEMRLHLERRVEENVAAGMSPGDARNEARRSFGGVAQVQEQCRDERRFVLVENTVQDIRFALRGLAKSPGFTAVALLTLALGIGVNTAIFSLVDAIVLRPAVALRPEEVVNLFTGRQAANREFRPFSHAEFLALREAKAMFAEVAATRFTTVGIAGADGVGRARAFFTSENYFAMLGAQPTLGRFYTAEEARPNAGIPVVVASHALWQRHGARPDFVGSTLAVNGRACTVIGVAPARFNGTMVLFDIDLWAPLGLVDDLKSGPRQDLAAADAYRLSLTARLAPGVTLASFPAHQPALRQRLDALQPEPATAARDLVAEPPSRGNISSQPSGGDPALPVAIGSFSMAACVLLIACVNLANMLLARGAAREKEIALRLALGANRPRIVRQLLAEGFVLAAAGAALGLLVSLWGNSLLARSFANLARLNGDSFALNLQPDARVLGVTCLLCVAATLVFSLGPALRVSRTDLTSSLKRQGDGSEAVARFTRFFSLRHCLVMGQIALSLVLLFAAGLFFRGAARAAAVTPGFDPAGVVAADLDYALTNLPPEEARRSLFAALDRAAAQPGATAVAAATFVPYAPRSEGRRVWPAEVPPVPESEVRPGMRFAQATYTAITDGYFAAVGVRLLRGRDFTPAEARDAERSAVAIVDETFARTLYPDTEVLGRRIRIGTVEREIVGVCAPHRHNVRRAEFPPRVFVPYAAGHDGRAFLLVRYAAPDALAPAAALLAALRGSAPGLPLLQLRAFSDMVAQDVNVWLTRAGAIVFGLFGASALLLAVVGIYGVKAYAVSRRTREIGIRLAIGAQPRDVLGLVLRQGALQIIVALAAGTLLALGTGRMLAQMLYQVSPADPLALATSVFCLAATALLACWIPARRAAKVDPMIALRAE